MPTTSHIMQILKEHLRVETTQETAVVDNGYQITVNVSVSAQSMGTAAMAIVQAIFNETTSMKSPYRNTASRLGEILARWKPPAQRTAILEASQPMSSAQKEFVPRKHKGWCDEQGVAHAYSELPLTDSFGPRRRWCCNCGHSQTLLPPPTIQLSRWVDD